MDQVAVPAALYRGGTSKAVFVNQRDLPTQDPGQLEEWIVAIFGSPDRRQIDGVGGATIVTSKFAVIGPPTRPDADLDYTFYQVIIDRPEVSMDLNCGNISAAVGPYAIERGFVKASGDSALVRVHATNFDNMIYLTVPTKDGKPRVLGDEHIAGVPGTGAPIQVDLRDLVGTHRRGLLPTGSPRDVVTVDGLGPVDISLVDTANLTCFVKAESLGLTGTEDPSDMMVDDDLMTMIENVRFAGAVKVGTATDLEDANKRRPVMPWLSIVSRPQSWIDHSTRTTHSADECDFMARLTVHKQVHQAYPGTGSVCSAVASRIPDTVVSEVCQTSNGSDLVRLGHPCGTIAVAVSVEETGENRFVIHQASIVRTARLLMDGTVYAAVDRLSWMGGSTEAPESDPSLRTEKPDEDEEYMQLQD